MLRSFIHMESDFFLPFLFLVLPNTKPIILDTVIPELVFRLTTGEFLNVERGSASRMRHWNARFTP